MDNIEEQAVFDTVKEYLNVRKDLALLKVTDKVSHSIAVSVGILVISILVIFSLLFFSVAIGLLIAEKMGSVCLGFSIVAGFYVLATLLVFLTRKSMLERPLIDFLIKQILKERNKAIYENQN